MMKTLLCLCLLLIALINTTTGLRYQNPECEDEDLPPLTVTTLISLMERWEETFPREPMPSVASAFFSRYSIIHNDMNNLDRYKQRLVKDILGFSHDVPEDMFTMAEECALESMLSHNSHDVDGHPEENGVMYTLAGPVAAGTLLAGLEAMHKFEGIPLPELPLMEEAMMPPEMQAHLLYPLYASTLSGDLAEMAAQLMEQPDMEPSVGPLGHFYTSSHCPKTYAFMEDDFHYQGLTLTRAEIFAGIDALLISSGLSEQWVGSDLRLSRVLAMYYGYQGLPEKPEYRSCNRMNLFETLDFNEIKTQAKYFMFGVIRNYEDRVQWIEDNMENFADIEGEFDTALETAWETFTAFVGPAYPYEDYEPCPAEPFGGQCLSEVDLVVVTEHPRGGSPAIEHYLPHLVEYMSQGTGGSTLSIIDDRTARWVTELKHIQNMHRWSCNFHTKAPRGFKRNVRAVWNNLEQHYRSFYEHYKDNQPSPPMQVLLFNYPSKWQAQDFLDRMAAFQEKFPVVKIFVVGGETNNFAKVHEELPDISFDYSDTHHWDSFAENINRKICPDARPEFPMPTFTTTPAPEPEEVDEEETEMEDGGFTEYSADRPQVEDSGECSEGFIGVGSECFQVHENEFLRWDVARQRCKDEGLDLAAPSDPIMLRDFLQQHDLGYDYWLGARGTGDGFFWTNGEPVTGPWQPGHPFVTGRNRCVDFRTKSLPPLFDFTCSNSQRFICQQFAED